jgi:4'-phosphopantetheinyl transferase
MKRAEVDVWLLAQPGAAVPLDWLDDVERTRAATLSPRQAAGFVAARRLLRATLAERLGVPPADVPLLARCATCGGPHGQVRVGRTELGDGAPPSHVSISRSGPLVAVAMAELPVGVDVESVAAVGSAPLADVALSSGERERYALLPPGERPATLARTWARKESVLKALGTGLDRDPSSFSLTLPATRVGEAGSSERTVTVADLPPSLEAVTPHTAGIAVTDTADAVGAVAVAGVADVRVCLHDGAALLSRAGS